MTDPVVATWIAIAERFCKQNNLIWHQDFPSDHPISELERHLTAVFIRHQSIGPLVLAVIDRELSGSSDKLPAPVSDTIKLVHQTKWTLIKTRQQLNRSYKEVCAPILEKCRFLLYEIRPAISSEQAGLHRLNLLHKQPRFKTLVRRIIGEIQIAKKINECAKPDDILNVTIKSQQKNVATENSKKNSSIENMTQTVYIENKITSSVEAGGGDGDSNVLAEEKKADENLVILAAEETKIPANEQYDFERKEKHVENDEQFINNVIAKLSEKCIRVCEHGEQSSAVMAHIVDFVLQDNCDVETLRRAMYCQVQRYQIRKQGISLFTELLSVHGLLDAVQYNVLSGYLGLFLEKKLQLNFSGNILDDLNLITAFQKADLILTHSKIIEWSIDELQKFVNQEQAFSKQNHHAGKDNTNLGTYVFLKKLPRARFLLSVFGVLSKDLGSNELSLLINSGALGSILGLLRQTGGGGGTDSTSLKIGTELSCVYQDTILRVSCSKKINKNSISFWIFSKNQQKLM